MGCDIHCHIEIKVKGTWHTYTIPDVTRYYDLFGMMAGVRHHDLMLFEPKGMPEDASVVAKVHCDYWGGNGHHHSWLGLDEIKQLEAEMKKTLGVRLADYFGFLFGCGITEKFEDVEDVRFVFWFDN